MKAGWLAGAVGGLLLLALLALGNVARAQEADTALDPVWGPFAKVVGRTALGIDGKQLRWRWETPGKKLAQEWFRTDGYVVRRVTVTLGKQPNTLSLYGSGGAKEAMVQPIEWIGRLQDDGSMLFVGTSPLTKQPYVVGLNEQGMWEERPVKLKGDAIASIGAPPLGAFTLQGERAVADSVAVAATPVASPDGAVDADAAAWGDYLKVIGTVRQAQSEGGYRLSWQWVEPGKVLQQDWADPKSLKVQHSETISVGEAPGQLVLKSALFGKRWFGTVRPDGSVFYVGKGLMKKPHVVALTAEGIWEYRDATVSGGDVVSLAPAAANTRFVVVQSPGAAQPAVAGVPAAAATAAAAPAAPMVDPAQVWRAKAEASVAAAARAIEAAKARIPESGAGTAPLTASAMLQSAGAFKDWPIIRRLVDGKVWISTRAWQYSGGAWVPRDYFVASGWAWGADGVLENVSFGAPGSQPPATGRYRQSPVSGIVEYGRDDGNAGLAVAKAGARMVVAVKRPDGEELEGHYALAGQSLVYEVTRVAEGRLHPLWKVQLEARPEMRFDDAQALVAEKGAELQLRLAQQRALEAQRAAEAAAAEQLRQAQALAEAQRQASQSYNSYDPYEDSYEEEAPRPNLMETFANTFANEMAKQAAQQAEFQRGLNDAIRRGEAERQRREAAQRAAEARARQMQWAQSQQQSAWQAQQAAEQARQAAEAQVREAQAAAERARRAAEERRMAQQPTRSASSNPMSSASAGGGASGARSAGQAMTSDDDAMQCVSRPISVPNTAFPKGSAARISNNCAYPVRVRICLRMTEFWNCGADFGVKPGADWTWSTSLGKYSEAFMDAVPSSSNRSLKHPPPGLPVR